MITLRLTESPSRDMARAVLSWPSVGYPGDLTDYLEVEVYKNHRGAFWVALHLDFRGDQFLSSWCVQRCIADRAEAAREAADLWAEGVRIVGLRLAGRTIRAPGALMADAWEAGEGRALTEALVATMRARGAERDDREQFAVGWSSKDGGARDYDEARRAWMRATDWRGYRDAEPIAHRDMKPANRGQMALLEVA